MRSARRRLIGLCLVPALLAALDGCVTLIGQPDAFWAGDYSRAIEGTPGFRILLMHGPAAYVAGLLVWTLAFGGMILLLPSTLALAACLLFTLGHTIGAFSWMDSFPHGREIPIVVNVIVAVGLAVGIRWGWECGQRDDEPMGASLPTPLRWALFTALCAIPIYFTWPLGL